jgi:predicted ferric reductase
VADRSGERTLWLAGYVALVLAPVVLLVVAPYPGTASFATTVAAGLGFAGLTVLALQVVMPSRARAFTAPFGIDVLLRFHRQLGAVALILVIAHVVVLIADDSSRFSLLDLVHAPFRAKAGVIAILALLALTATSLWRRPLRLPYEAWRALHVLLGLAVIGFAFAHVIGVSKFVATGSVRWGVLLFVLAAGAAAFYLRIGRPFAAGARPYAVREVRRERGGATTLELAADGHAGVPFGPGQFAWIKLAQAPYSLTEHPFSFASSAERPERPAFTIKSLGDFTERVAELEPGTPVLLDGPHGSFREALPDAGFVLVAGGIGITPAMSLLRTLADRGDRRPVTLVYGQPRLGRRDVPRRARRAGAATRPRRRPRALAAPGGLGRRARAHRRGAARARPPGRRRRAQRPRLRAAGDDGGGPGGAARAGRPARPAARRGLRPRLSPPGPNWTNVGQGGGRTVD